MTLGPDDQIEKRACISGVGQSQIGRRLYRDPLGLTLDACVAAVADAGLTMRDIDGISRISSSVRFCGLLTRPTSGSVHVEASISGGRATISMR